MNESDYINKSKDYATNAQQDYENSLSYLISGLDEAKTLDQNAANIRYQNLINQIRQQIPGIQETFNRNAKAAYINKQLSLQQINGDLSRLGVNTQGFGVTQRLLNENAYGQVYGDLVLDYNESMRDIANQETNALGDLNAELADLDAAYAKDKLETQKYISEQGREIYNTEYNNYYNNLQYQDKLKQQELENERYAKEYADKLKQQEWENAFKEKQYQDQLKQQKFENDLATKEYNLKVKQLNKMSSSSGSKTTTKTSGSGAETKRKTTYCLNPTEFSSASAFKVYNSIISTEMSRGGLTKSEITALLNQYGSSLTASDKAAIKKQYGILEVN